MKPGVTDTTTITVLITDTIVDRYDLADTTNCSSTVYMSLLNLLTIIERVQQICKRIWEEYKQLSPPRTYPSDGSPVK